MKKLALAYVAFSLALLPGCGKKEQKNKKEEKSALKRLFSEADGDSRKELPIYTAERETVVDESVVSDFAFVDEDADLSVKQKDDSVQVAERNDDEAVAPGMPMAREEQSEELLASVDEDIKNLEFDRVQFDINGNKIKKDQKVVVENDIKKAKQAVEQGKEIVISGHTCQLGSASYNLALSQRRADAVKKEMIASGIPAEKIKTVGYGYESPLVWTDKEEREAKIAELAPNRRAEVSIK